MRPPGLSDSERATRIFRRLLTRPPAERELAILLKFRQDQLGRFAAGELKATEIAGDEATSELAAWSMVARVVMNLDETITKR
jgi:hypothetical protein